MNHDRGNQVPPLLKDQGKYQAHESDSSQPCRSFVAMTEGENHPGKEHSHRIVHHRPESQNQITAEAGLFRLHITPCLSFMVQ